MPTRTDDNLRGALYERTGMNFFACEIDGEWHGGWFRIDGRRLEVNSETQRRTATIVDPDLLTDLLRKLMTQIVHESSTHEGSSPESSSPAKPTEPRAEQGLVSASLHSSNSTLDIAADPAKRRKQ